MISLSQKCIVLVISGWLSVIGTARSYLAMAALLLAEASGPPNTRATAATPDVAVLPVL
jgi:hypothetical protein